MVLKRVKIGVLYFVTFVALSASALSFSMDKLNIVKNIGHKMLFDKISNGDLKELKILVNDLKCGVNFVDKDGNTPLLFACELEKKEEDKLEIVKFLLSKSSKETINIASKETGRFPLYSVCRTNNFCPKIAEILIMAGANVNLVNKKNNLYASNLAFCVDNLNKNHLQESLFNLFIMFNGKIKKDIIKTIASHALKFGKNKSFELCVNRGFCIKEDFSKLLFDLLENSLNISQEHISGKIEILKYLISSGVDIKSFMTPNFLVRAVDFHHAGIIKILLSLCSEEVRNGVFLEKIDSIYIDGEYRFPIYSTVFGYACRFSTLDVVREFLKYKIDVNKIFENGCPALISAFSNKEHWFEIVKELLMRKDINVNVVFNAETPIYLACLNDSVFLVRLLLKKGADVNLGDKTSYCLFIFGTRSENLNLRQIVELLVENGKEVSKEAIEIVSPRGEMRNSLNFFKAINRDIEKEDNKESKFVFDKKQALVEAKKIDYKCFGSLVMYFLNRSCKNKCESFEGSDFYKLYKDLDPKDLKKIFKVEKKDNIYDFLREAAVEETILFEKDLFSGFIISSKLLKNSEKFKDCVIKLS